ncbi:hypothetical protein MUN78_10040 [Leucobacter allii]|uniref:HTH cro/C1-type domain-containing protein n=1 Tax=Leucobacter allii TaxID=2932247 RepID=A0ABY4FJ41_9MICO|nr:hypothetical protein [Leucobacter allii]UOQ56043.1 hypothetical protein MUN78_10040 [Leucobacter allii]
MSPRATAGEPTDFSSAVAETIDRQIGLSGIPVAHVIKEAGLSRNYYYKRIRGEGMFNTNDIDTIARALGMDPFDLIRMALAEMSRKKQGADIHDLDSRRASVAGVYEDGESRRQSDYARAAKARSKDRGEEYYD